ncbi:methyl-accepting chemotaxis protein [Thalassotalea sp. 1_MG-2023]|uniref:methyl-accepting chemotaxis protein n=1 Tax=Thalassotalea sp. 1_MG-2023 TaxID=3062680 RepID=UPI0026E21DF2|nr:methyl-accepting chemotaxis protein [Thalassotalea sp. 1_MG-2023]MDO6426123.1 methyl-accepting chemotaxis protein [Thalassotalea sp. 1_MG-2023]
MQINISAVNKITAGYAIIITFLLIVGYQGFTSIATINSNLHNINQQAAPITELSNRLNQHLSTLNLLMYQHYNADEPHIHQQYRELYQAEKLALTNKITALLNKLLLIKNASKQVAQLKALKEKLDQTFDNIELTMTLSETVLENYADVVSSLSDIDSIEQQITAHTSSLAQLTLNAEEQYLLAEVTSSIQHGAATAKLLATTQNYDHATQLSQEFASWLTHYVTLGFDIVALQSTPIKKQAFKQFSVLAADLAYIVESERGLVEKANTYLSAKQTLDNNLKGNQSQLLTSITTMNDISLFAKEYSNIVATDAADTVEENQLFIIIFCSVAVFLAVVIALMAIKGIRKPLNDVNNILAKMATGDLTQEISITSQDEFGQLKQSAKTLNNALKDMIDAIQAQSITVTGSVSETNTSTIELQENISDQQAQTELVVTAMNEMAMTIKEVAQNAQVTFSEMESAAHSAQQSKAHVQENSAINASLEKEIENATQVIQALDQDVSQIEEILHVIESIAAQTNLLALNAAIEAARAGEQGRGFAVVADEVRTLAKRTQDSTEEIKHNIETMLTGSRQAVSVMAASQHQTQAAVTKSEQVYQSIDNIVSIITNTKALNMQIATASEEQSVTAEEINRNIVNISDMAEGTVTCSNRNKAAINKLTHAAQELDNLIGKFRV